MSPTTEHPPVAPSINPPEPFLALDRLNSWVRSREPFFCPLRSALTPVVYWVKNKAILDASKRWAINLRRIMVSARCRVCGGTGIYETGYYHDEYDEEPCRTCRATGSVALKFIESAIGPVRWHTPLHKWLSGSLDVYVGFPEEGEWHLAVDWKPNQPGRKMRFDEVERDILAVLNEWPHDVAFILGFHHRVDFERQGRCIDRSKAERWLRDLIRSAPQSIQATASVSIGEIRG